MKKETNNINLKKSNVELEKRDRKMIKYILDKAIDTSDKSRGTFDFITLSLFSLGDIIQTGDKMLLDLTLRDIIRMFVQLNPQDYVNSKN
jgi:hypothetical protein